MKTVLCPSRIRVLADKKDAVVRTSDLLGLPHWRLLYSCTQCERDHEDHHDDTGTFHIKRRYTTLGHTKQVHVRVLSVVLYVNFIPRFLSESMIANQKSAIAAVTLMRWRGRGRGRGRTQEGRDLNTFQFSGNRGPTYGYSIVSRVCVCYSFLVALHLVPLDCKQTLRRSNSGSATTLPIIPFRAFKGCQWHCRTCHQVVRVSGAPT